MLQHAAWVEALKDEVLRLRRWTFGRSSESFDPRVAPELPLMGGIVAATATTATTTTPNASDTPRIPKLVAVDAPVAGSRARRSPRVLDADLPRVIRMHNPVSCTCEACGGALTRLGETASEQLDYVPGYFQVIRHVRPKLACTACVRIVQASAPSRPIERGLPTAGLLAQVVASKYADHCPLYRQEGIYRRAGVELPRATLASWVRECADLLDPLVSALGRYVLSAEKLHADDTPVPVLSPGQGRTKTGRLWAYVRDDRPSSGVDPPAVLYRYSPDRKGERPASHLSRFRGVLQADGYVGFGPLYASGRMVEAACWAHARRKYYDLFVADRSPTAAEALRRIGLLYVIEREIRGQSPTARAAVRQARSAPLLQDLQGWLMETHRSLSVKSPLAAAIQYTLGRWAALNRYVTDGRIEIGRVDDWRGKHTRRGFAVIRRSRCLIPSRVSRFQSPLVEPDMQISRIRLSRMSLRPSRSPQLLGLWGVGTGRVPRRGTCPGIGDTQCPAYPAVAAAIAAHAARCTAG